MPSKILSDNFLDLALLANASVSSEQAAFPIENAYNKQRRSRVWRSAGYWEIVSGQDNLEFKDSIGGPTLTANIAIGEYSSDAAMFAAVKAAMEAVGANTYTLSRDTVTNKINIASDGSEFEIVGGTFSGVIGFSIFPKTGAQDYNADLLRIHTSEWVKWDFGISSNPDAFVLIGKRNKPINISPSATIRLQGNATDVWTNPEYNELLDYSDAIISKLKTDGAQGLHTQALRFWRLYIEDRFNPTGYVEIGALFLGDYFEPERGRIQFPFTGAYIDRSETTFSEGGQTFSNKREKSESFDVTWSAMTTEDKESIDSIFSRFGTSEPFFVAFDPLLSFSSSDGYYTRFVKFDQPPRYNLERPNFWNMTMSLREEL